MPQLTFSVDCGFEIGYLTVVLRLDPYSLTSIISDMDTIVQIETCLFIPIGAFMLTMVELSSVIRLPNCFGSFAIKMLIV